MNKSAGSKNRKKRTNKVLTKVEKLDGYFPGLATEARMLLDQGVAAPETARILREHFPVPLTDSSVEHFREHRWKPQKETADQDAGLLQGLFDKAGGNTGLDLLAFARVHELLKTSDLKQANAIRLSLLKIRAQDLKEKEFLFKLHQQTESEKDEKEDDPATEEIKTKRVMNKIRGIFGLEPLPDDTADEDPQTESQAQQVPSEFESEFTDEQGIAETPLAVGDPSNGTTGSVSPDFSNSTIVSRSYPADDSSN